MICIIKLNDVLHSTHAERRFLKNLKYSIKGRRFQKYLNGKYHRNNLSYIKILITHNSLLIEDTDELHEKLFTICESPIIIKDISKLNELCNCEGTHQPKYYNKRRYYHCIHLKYINYRGKLYFEYNTFIHELTHALIYEYYKNDEYYSAIEYNLFNELVAYHMPNYLMSFNYYSKTHFYDNPIEKDYLKEKTINQIRESILNNINLAIPVCTGMKFINKELNLHKVYYPLTIRFFKSVLKIARCFIHGITCLIKDGTWIIMLPIVMFIIFIIKCLKILFTPL